MTQVSLDKLSKKNQEFVHIATHQLIKDGKTDEEIKALLEEIIPTILKNQAKGITARGLYGAPTVWAANFSEAKQKEAQTIKENTNPYLMIMDAFLFVFSLFAILNSSVNLLCRPGPKSETTIFQIASYHFSCYDFVGCCSLRHNLPVASSFKSKTAELIYPCVWWRNFGTSFLSQKEIQYPQCFNRTKTTLVIFLFEHPLVSTGGCFNKI